LDNLGNKMQTLRQETEMLQNYRRRNR